MNEAKIKCEKTIEAIRILVDHPTVLSLLDSLLTYVSDAVNEEYHLARNEGFTEGYDMALREHGIEE